jgi:hypothetical protein
MTVSVCAPFWRCQPALDRMVEQYGRLYPDLDIELSICDDGSPEPAVAEGVTLTRLPEKSYPLNPCVPINRAVAASGGDVIVLTNPEMVHEGKPLYRLLELLEDENDYVTGVAYGIGYGRERLLLAGAGVDYTTHGRLPVPLGAHYHFLAAFHRTLWDKAGGFDEEYRHVQGCEDNDWLWRCHRVGARFRAARKGHVWQEKSTTRWGMPHGRELFAAKWPGVV